MSSFLIRGGRRALVTLAAVAGVALAAAGCSSSSSSSSASLPSAPLATPSAGASLPAASGQLTGTQLAPVLLPASDFPAGFAVTSAGTVSSGGSLTTGPAKYNLATASCATFVQHLGTAGFGETALVFGSVTASGQGFDQFIYQFASPAAASAFVADIQSLASRCGSFTTTSNGTKGTFSLRATPGSAVGGHPSLEVQQTGTLGKSPVALDILFCASGVDVFAASGVGVGGAAAPALPTKDTIVYNLMKRQAAIALLS